MKEFVEKLIGMLEELKSNPSEKTCRENILLAMQKNLTIYSAIEIVNQLAEEYNNGWIAFTQREMTEEEKEVYGEDLEYILDCKLPDDGEEIIVCYKNGYVDTDTFIRDTDGCYLDSGNDFIDDVIAWMPLPAPYQKGE